MSINDITIESRKKNQGTTILNITIINSIIAKITNNEENNCHKKKKVEK